MSQSNQFSIRKPRYLQEFSCMVYEKALSELLLFFQRYSYRPITSLLDVMCGTGISGQYLLEHIDMLSHVTFFDGSREMLDAVVADGEKIHGFVSSLPFTDSVWEGIVCRGGLNNITCEEYPGALREMIRVLHPHGLLVVQDHFSVHDDGGAVDQFEKALAVFEGRNDLPFSPTFPVFSDMVKEAGGVVVGCHSFSYFFSLTERFLAKGYSNQDLCVFLERCVGAQPRLCEKGGEWFGLCPVTTIAIYR